MSKEFFKFCPICNIKVYFKNKNTLSKSIKNNSKCHSCRNKESNTLAEYNKKVKVLFGLIVEKTDIDDEYFRALLKYLKEDVQKGKKTIIDINPEVFGGNRTWGNGYAITQKH